MPSHPLPLRRSRRLRGQEPGEECPRSSCWEDKEHEAKPASTQTQSKPASTQTQSEALVKVPELSGCCPSSSPVPCVWERLWREWGRRFCIRLYRHGCFHTYPDVGGPFQSLLETYKAIDQYLEARRDPKMCVEEDKAIRRRLYWPDGTVKRRIKSSITEKSEMCQIVQALVDKHNEDDNLFEGLALELEDVLHYKSICEKQKWYYHINFTTKIKGAGPNAMDNLFFVEVKCMPQGRIRELQANCFCKVNLNDNGQCYACTRNEDVGMKHPSSSGYTAGHLKVGLPFGYFAKWKSAYEDEEDDDKYVKAREAELRQMFKGLERPGVMKKLCTPPPWATKRKVLE